MPHVTLIHGISNKPPAADLLRLWRAALADGAEPLPLGDLGVSTSIVYWADLLYDAPDMNLAAYEGVLENSAEAIDAGDAPAPPLPETAEEARFLAGVRAKMTVISDAELAVGALPDVPPVPIGNLERIPLPWFIKKAFLDTYLRDVHHYLFNTRFAPAGREPVAIQDTIRARVVEALQAVGDDPPHIVVSHSLGTVIAYDCLQRVAGCPAVDGLITIGSPLGLDEVQDRLQPEWTRNDGYPATVQGEWHNLFDRLDPVCGFDPKLANDFRGRGTITDTAVVNDGTWRHSATKYLRQPAFRAALRHMLGV